MKYMVIVFTFFFSVTLYAIDGFPDGTVPLLEEPQVQKQPQRQTQTKQPQQQNRNSQIQNILKPGESMTITVKGEGVAPQNVISPAQAYALAKRAATVDGYRLIAERVNGVHIDGRDRVGNMVVQDSRVDLRVAALVRNAQVIETVFQDGLCQVEMEITIRYEDF